MDIFYYIVFMEKKCTKCGKSYPLTAEFFHRSKYSKTGFNPQCKPCALLKRKKYREKNREKLRTYAEWYRSIPENREVVKAYKERNKEKIKEYAKEYQRKRREEDIMFKLSQSIRDRVNKSTRGRGYSKKTNTYKILGCDFQTFKSHIESYFQDGMSWDNYGEWVYDHHYPICLAKNENDLMILNYYKNYRPLWKIDNLTKNARVPDGYEEWYKEISKTRPSF